MALSEWIAVGLVSAGRARAAAGRDQEPTALLQSPVGGSPKRAFDVIIASVALVLLMPVLAALALAIKLNMGGKVIYRHRRIGFAGRPFDCLKFRTMVANGEEVLLRHFNENPAAADEWKRNRKLENDPRVTALGWVLRKTSLDELPQLINVLRGEMTCVGPRPVVAEEIARYGVHAGDYFRARPGVSGPWQVSGRSSVSYEERVLMDVEYVQNWSFGQDMIIVLRTLPAALKLDQAA